MVKKTVTYIDYNGTERTEDFYFNLTQAELIELQLKENGDLGEKLQSIIRANDQASIVKIFKEILIMAYGEKSPDGKRFIKNDDVRDAFTQTEAYSQIFMELATNDEAGAEFINGLIPKDLAKKIEKGSEQ